MRLQVELVELALGAAAAEAAERAAWLVVSAVEVATAL
jgi:hypothetical protein